MPPPSASMSQRPTRADWASLLSLVLMWGTAFVVIRQAVQTVSPLSVAAGRILAAALLLCIAVPLSGLRFPPWGRIWLQFSLVNYLVPLASEKYVRRAQAEGRHFLLESKDAPVAYTAFNAELPDCVQVGGVYTPPELRSRGYARCAVAASLLSARERGVRRSVLFTAEDNQAAQTAYHSLGYERVGDYALVLFAQPRRP